MPLTPAEIKLAELKASDMIDVLHYFFEEDMYVASGEQAEAKSRLRVSIYQNMYGTTYKYGYESAESRNKRIFDEAMMEPDLPAENIKPFDPVRQPTKGYIPPTQFNPESPTPFGDLDAPLR
jgi:hypothetical protein